jgi:hypothetical protein
MKIVFNSNITEIRVYPKARYYSDLALRNGLVFKGRKYLIFPIYERKEGLFRRWDGEYWGSIDDYNTKDRKSYVEDGEFYSKPHYELHMNNGKHHEVYFETVEELNEAVNGLKNMAPHIIVK